MASCVKQWKITKGARGLPRKNHPKGKQGWIVSKKGSNSPRFAVGSKKRAREVIRNMCKS